MALRRVPDCNTRNRDRTGPGHVDSEADSTLSNDGRGPRRDLLKDESFTCVTDFNRDLHGEKR